MSEVLESGKPNETGLTETIDQETAARIKIQAMIYRIEYLGYLRMFSPERLWRSFFELMAKEFGSIAEAVRLMLANGEDKVRILRLLKLSGYSNKEVVEFFLAAGLALKEVVSANFWLNEDFTGEEVGIAQADLNALDFLLSAGVGKSQVVSALFSTDCLNRRTVNRLISWGWKWQSFFRALFESGHFNTRTYKMLLGFKDKQKKAMFNDNKIMVLMSESGISDSRIIFIWQGAGKKLHQIYKLCLDSGWTEERLLAAMIEGGLSPGAVVCAYGEYATGQVNDKENQMEWNIKDHTDAQKDVELSQIANAIEGEIVAIKAKTLSMLQKLVISDREVVAQLSNQELTNMRIIDLLSAAGWTPERAISALLEAGKKEFAIMEAINELADDYEFKGNNYWEADRIRLWKDALNKFFPSRDIAAAIAME